MACSSLGCWLIPSTATEAITKQFNSPNRLLGTWLGIISIILFLSVYPHFMLRWTIEGRQNVQEKEGKSVRVEKAQGAKKASLKV